MKKCNFCKKTILYDEFRDMESLNEYKRTGICQDCQDKIFKGETNDTTKRIFKL